MIRAGKGALNSAASGYIGPSLVKALERSSAPKSMTAQECYAAINRWEDQKSRRQAGRLPRSPNRAECFRVFVDIGGSLTGAITYAEKHLQGAGQLTSNYSVDIKLKWLWNGKLCTILDALEDSLESLRSGEDEAEAAKNSTSATSSRPRAKRNLLPPSIWKGFHE